MEFVDIYNNSYLRREIIQYLTEIADLKALFDACNQHRVQPDNIYIRQAIRNVQKQGIDPLYCYPLRSHISKYALELYTPKYSHQTVCQHHLEHVLRMFGAFSDLNYVLTRF